MNILQILVGSFLLELIGVCVRYMYLNTSSLIGFNEYTTFRKIWSPNKKKHENSTTNHGVGVIVFGIIIILLIILLSKS